MKKQDLSLVIDNQSKVSVKKVISILMIILFCFVCVPSHLEAASAAPVIKVEGNKLNWKADYGAAYYGKNHEAMVPVKALAEALGAKFSWNKSARTAVITRKDGQIFSVVEKTSNISTPYGYLKMNETAVSVKENLFIPLKSLANILGYDVQSSSDSENLVRNSNGISGNHERVYSIYGKQLGYESELAGAVTADLDHDGINELIYIASNSRGPGYSLRIQKAGTFVTQKDFYDDLGYNDIRGSSCSLEIYSDINGYEYLGITLEQTPASNGLDFEYSTLNLYHLNEDLKKVLEISCDTVDGKKVSTINGKSYAGVSRYKSEKSKFSLKKDILRLIETDAPYDKTQKGKDILVKAEAEEKAWSAFFSKAVLSPVQKVIYGITKDLVGINLGESIDSSKYEKLWDGEGTEAFAYKNRDGKTIYGLNIGAGILQSLDAQKGSELWGIKIGTSKLSDVEMIFGKGIPYKNTAENFIAPVGSVSSVRYDYGAGNYFVEFFFDKSKTAIGAFLGSRY